MEQCCKNCAYLDVGPDSSGRRVVRKDYVYPCIVAFNMPDFPDCMPLEIPRRRNMEGSDGTTCAFFEPIDKGPTT